MMMEIYKRTVVGEDGPTVVTESVPGLRSVSLGLWVRVGARDEVSEQQGISHFVEHAVFKGTTSRDAFDIANSLESLGGNLDAFTSRDVTCYHGRCLAEHLDIALAVLADLLQNPMFDPAELTKERRVILEEIQSVEDTPEDLIHDLFAQSVWGRDPVGAPILGTPDTVNAFTQDDLFEFTGRHYRPSNMIISAAGHLDHASVVEQVEKLFGSVPASSPARRAPSRAPRSYQHYYRDIGQTHLCLVTTSWSYIHPRQYDLLVANTVLGGGMTSRLFQEIREKRGLAYSVYSYVETLEDTGLFSTYMACDRCRLKDAVEVMWTQLLVLKECGITEVELASAKAQLKGELILGAESMSNRMSNLAYDEMYLQRYLSMDDTLKEIESVTLEGVYDACQTLHDEQGMHQVTVGP
ncbi:MAG TPA: peptidase M16 [Candidatus Latescibacteria bacterium]|nr:peptidase M16 [Candidatus Latescibacterota bacterium]